MRERERVRKGNRELVIINTIKKETDDKET